MTEIALEQRIAAPPSTVYRYLTESEKWLLWQGASASIDAIEGGIFSMVMRNGMKARGQFVELVKNTRVVFTWGWVDRPGIPPGSTTVEIDLVSDGEGTLLVLTHRNLPEDEVPEHKTGWVYHLPRLAAVAAGQDPGPDVGPGG